MLTAHFEHAQALRGQQRELGTEAEELAAQSAALQQRGAQAQARLTEAETAARAHEASLQEAGELTRVRAPNPRNPRHFNIIEGGRKRVSTIFMDKNSVSCA